MELKKGYNLKDFVEDNPKIWYSLIKKSVKTLTKKLNETVFDEIITEYICLY